MGGGDEMGCEVQCGMERVELERRADGGQGGTQWAEGRWMQVRARRRSVQRAAQAMEMEERRREIVQEMTDRWIV